MRSFTATTGSAARRLRLAGVLSGCVALACSACSSAHGGTPAPTQTSSAAAPTAAPTSAAHKTHVMKPAHSTAPPPPPASVKANELGLVPVLMYHRLVAKPASDYERSPEQFSGDLT